MNDFVRDDFVKLKVVVLTVIIVVLVFVMAVSLIFFCIDLDWTVSQEGVAVADSTRNPLVESVVFQVDTCNQTTELLKKIKGYDISLESLNLFKQVVTNAHQVILTDESVQDLMTLVYVRKVSEGLSEFDALGEMLCNSEFRLLVVSKTREKCSNLEISDDQCTDLTFSLLFWFRDNYSIFLEK